MLISSSSVKTTPDLVIGPLASLMEDYGKDSGSNENTGTPPSLLNNGKKQKTLTPMKHTIAL
jgi:hypothetical protein